MNYTFKGKDCPKELKLHHPEVETNLIIEYAAKL
jgi:hypothetical protein